MVRFKKPNAISSYTEMKESYIKALKALDECRKERSRAFIVGRTDRKQLEETREVVKEVDKEVRILTTEKEQAQKQSRQTAVSSTAAGTIMCGLYQIWDIQGYPGGGRWNAFWEHEAISGAIMWGLTIGLVLFHRIYHNT